MILALELGGSGRVVTGAVLEDGVVFLVLGLYPGGLAGVYGHWDNRLPVEVEIDTEEGCERREEINSRTRSSRQLGRLPGLDIRSEMSKVCSLVRSDVRCRSPGFPLWQRLKVSTCTLRSTHH